MADHNRMEISHDVDDGPSSPPPSPSTPTPTGHTTTTTTTTLTVAPDTASSELATTNNAGLEVFQVPVLQGMCPACGSKIHHLVLVAANASVEVGNDNNHDNVITPSLCD